MGDFMPCSVEREFMNSPGRIDAPDWLTLDADEQVRVRARPSKNLLLVTFVVGTALLLGVGVVAVLFDIDIMTGRLLSVAVLLVIMLMTGGVYLLTRRLEYVVTNHRIYEAVGLTSKEASAVDLDDVNDLHLEQSNVQGWLSVGDIRVETDDGTAVRFRSIGNPQLVYEHTLELLETR